MLMKILASVTPTSYLDSRYQNVSLENIVEGFADAKADCYNKREPVWLNLQKSLAHAHVSHNTIPPTGIVVQAPEVASAILGEAVEYFSRAFCNFFAQDKLTEHGYSTWSSITNYYLSFFSIHALLRLQGRCITRIWRNMRQQFYIFPFEFTEHQYAIIRCKGNAHDTAWETFYDVYDGFSYVENPDFEYGFKKKYVGRVDEEVEFRNRINYEPYQGYEEVWDPTCIPEFISQYENRRFDEGKEVETLTQLTTELDYRDYARAALRLIFCHQLLSHIANRNHKVSLLLSNRKISLGKFISLVHPRVDVHMITARMVGLMDLENSALGNAVEPAAN
jgi:hypothetical protein